MNTILIGIAGGTGSGKTTFLNNLLKILDIHKRILTIEDTRELMVPHPNRVHVVLKNFFLAHDFFQFKGKILFLNFSADTFEVTFVRPSRKYIIF